MASRQREAPRTFKEPRTRREWKLLANWISRVQTQEYPEADPVNFGEFRKALLNYSSGRAFVIPLLLGTSITAVFTVLQLARVIDLGGFGYLLLGLCPSFLSLAIARVADNNARSRALGLGWSVGVFASQPTLPEVCRDGEVQLRR